MKNYYCQSCVPVALSNISQYVNGWNGKYFKSFAYVRILSVHTKDARERSKYCIVWGDINGREKAFFIHAYRGTFCWYALLRLANTIVEIICSFVVEKNKSRRESAFLYSYSKRQFLYIALPTQQSAVVVGSGIIHIFLILLALHAVPSSSGKRNRINPQNNIFQCANSISIRSPIKRGVS